MAVLCRQTAEGEPEQTHQIEPHSSRQSDRALLKAKAAGASDKGWTVEWIGPTSFTASKVRWADILCTRTFWID